MGSRPRMPAMSAPATKALPSPVRMTTRVAGRALISAMAALRSASTSWLSAFSLSGRFIVTRLRGPSWASRTKASSRMAGSVMRPRK